ncbi:hypothetical protein ES708_19228 [subsurface metagenome]
MGLQILEGGPEKGRHQHRPHTLPPEIDNAHAEERRIEAQVHDQKKHDRDAGIERKLPIPYDNEDDPVHQTGIIHKTRSKSRTERTREVFVSDGMQERYQRDPYEKAQVRFGKGQKYKESGNQRE